MQIKYKEIAKSFYTALIISGINFEAWKNMN